MLRSKMKKIEEKEECNPFFIKLQKEINANRELKHLTEEKQVYLSPDASDNMIGGIVFYSCKNNNDQNHDLTENPNLITYFSKKLTDIEKNSPKFERELIALIVAMKDFAYTIRSYNKNL
jgi:RNase H-like domain found in reverse transcriptase